MLRSALSRPALRFASVTLTLTALLLAGCASGPRATATVDAIEYTLPTGRARNVTLPPQTLVRIDGNRQSIVGRWVPAREAVMRVGLTGVDTQSCFVAFDAQRRPVAVRNDKNDPFTFRLPRHAESERLRLAYAAVLREHGDALRGAVTEQQRLNEARGWLAATPFYRDSTCLTPPPRAVPVRPAGACAPGAAQEHGQQVCWGSFVVGYGCDKARAMMGLNGSLANLAGSVGCSALSAAAQGEQLTLEGWLADLLIDGTLTRCLEGMARGENVAGNMLCAAFLAVPFAAKMQSCIDQSARRCSATWQAWSSAATEAREFPARTVATCQASVARVAAGDAPMRGWEERARELSPRVEAARSAWEAARGRIGTTDLAQHPCGPPS